MSRRMEMKLLWLQDKWSQNNFARAMLGTALSRRTLS
jgi:hypothetical protein